MFLAKRKLLRHKKQCWKLPYKLYFAFVCILYIFDSMRDKVKIRYKLWARLPWGVTIKWHLKYHRTLLHLCTSFTRSASSWTQQMIYLQNYLLTQEDIWSPWNTNYIASLQALWAPTHMLRQENAQRPQTDALAARVDTIIVEIWGSLRPEPV